MLSTDSMIVSFLLPWFVSSVFHDGHPFVQMSVSE